MSSRIKRSFWQLSIAIFAAMQVVSTLVNCAPAQHSNSTQDITYLKHPGTPAYFLDSGDLLGIFIEGVLGKLDSNPPIHLPEPGSDLPPSMGFPIVVQQNGTITLPIVKPLSVRGMTLEQTEQTIIRAYRGTNSKGEKILRDSSRIIVTLQRERTVRVTVIRQDEPASFNNRNFNRTTVNQRSDRSGRGTVLQMPAYKNDLLHAMIQTGGIPGVNAKPNVQIFRGETRTKSTLDNRTSSNDPFPRTNLGHSFQRSNRARAESQIPIRGFQKRTNESTNRTQPILGNGDIILVESKPTEVFYTSGLLRSNQYPFPRDKSIDVLQAIAIAGGSLAPQTSRLGYPRFPASDLLIVRNRAGLPPINIKVDLNEALNDPRQRIRIAPGDNLILNFKPGEQAANVGIEVLSFQRW
ncbi:MAG: polysaccharide biosynthesis/export family protein [Mariniblastus sp.]